MSVNITVAGVALPNPSGASDVDWAAQQVATLQALAAAATVSRKSVNVTPAGTGANTTEDNLMTYSLPAATLASNGMGVRVTAWGDGANTADATTVRFYFGSTKVMELVLMGSQANTWRLVAEVFRAGAATQVATCGIINGGAFAVAQQGNSAPTETLSGAVTIKCTGQRASTSTANSVRQLGMIVELIS